MPENLIGGERFEIRRQLGEGGMGVVYEAFDTRLKMTVALKTLRRTSANLLYHFKNEFRSLADLHHPNLITLYELFAEEGHWFFTMELVAGVGLVKYVRQASPAPVAESPDAQTVLEFGTRPAPVAGAAPRRSGLSDEDRVRRTLAQLAAGLSALHRAGKVHRDIKPSNILVDGSGRVVVMDFGLAADAALMEEWAATGVVAGTPAYMAPEQGTPGAVGTAADWYAVGAMLYEILSGRLPHGGATLESLIASKKSPPPPLASLGLAVEPPADLARLCERLLDPDPAARPGGDEILEQLGLDAGPRAADTAEIFVGRERELEALRTAYRDSAIGPVTVFVEGPSGLGKTALVDRFLQEPRGDGAMVLRGRCYAEESLPYKGFDGIVDALSRNLITTPPLQVYAMLPATAPEAARIFPVLVRVPLIDEPPASDVNALELRSRAFAALAGLFAAIAGRHRLVLFIDDLQWADPDSLLLLRELLHPDVAAPMLVIASVRTGTTDAATLARETRLVPRVIRVAPLDAGDTRALLDRLAPEQPEDRRAEIEREAGGHPLFIAELARSRMASGSGLDDALWERATALEADARRVLEVVAVAGAPIDLATVVEATGFVPARCARLATQLRAEHLVKKTPTTGGTVELEPYHDRVRESVLARLGDGERAATSRELARALLAANVGETAPELVVRHLLAAGDVARGIALAERAAERALAALAFDRAAEFLRTAIEAGPADPAHARRLHLARANALASAGRGAASAEAFLQAGAEVDDETRLDCRRRAAEQLLASGHVDRGLAELREVLAILDEPLPETPADALASLHRTRARIDAAPLPAAAGNVPVARDRDLLRRLDTCQATSIGLILVDNVRGADFQARALELALEARDPRRLLRAMILEGIYRGQEGAAGRARARELLDASERLAAGRDDPWMDSYLVFAEAWLSYYEGRFKRSVALFTSADDMFRKLPGVAWEQNTILIHRLRATDYQGAWAELRPLYDEYLRDARRRDDRYIEASIRRWFNVLWLAHDRPDMAGRDLDASPWTPPAEGRYHLQHFLELRARVELAFYRGDGASQGSWARPGLDAAEASLLFRIQIARAIAEWLRGRISACEGDAAGVEAMIAALDAHEINYASIWSGLLAGSARLLRGDRAGAIESLRATSRLARDNDFPLCATIADLRAAQLSADGGAENEALAWMRGQNIRNPPAMAEVFAPGYAIR